MAAYSRTDRHRRSGDRAAFTLMEMMIVIGLVGLIAGLALPSIVALYNAGADRQAYNLIAAQLTAARALAIEKGTFAGLHIQLADMREGEEYLNPDLKHVCFSCLVVLDRKVGTHGAFRLYGIPQQVPKPYALAEVSRRTVEGESFIEEAVSNVNDKTVPWNVTTFTVIFSPTGSAVTLVDGRNVTFATDEPVFRSTQDPNDFGVAGSGRLWTLPPAEPAVTAVALFNTTDYVLKAKAGQGSAYLTNESQLLAINVHTGQLFTGE